MDHSDSTVLKITDAFHAQNFQTRLHALKADDDNTDVILEASNGCQFKAHRFILSAASLFFKAMFADRASKNQEANIIRLGDVDPDALGLIISFIYQSSVEITDENVFSLMEAVDFLSIESMRPCIEHFLNKNATISMLKIIEMADRFNYVGLKEIMLWQCLSSTQIIAKANLTRLEEWLIFYPGRKEHQLLTIIYWICKDRERRLKHFPRLVRHLQVKDPYQFAEKYLQNHSCPLERHAEFLQCLQTENFESMPLLESSGQHRLHLKARLILALGGKSENFDSLRSIECFDHFEMLSPWALSYRSEKGNLGEHIILQGMQSPRSHFASAITYNYFYVIAGETGNDNQSVLTSCEEYCLVTNSWRYLPNLPEPRKHCAAAFLDGRIYVSGGVNSTELLVLNPQKDNAWRVRANLKLSRSQHCMVFTLGYLFLIGGVEDGHEEPTASVWRFDTVYSNFVEVAPMKHPRAQFGAAVFDGCIYVMGGRNKDCYLRTVEKYDIFGNVWTTMNDMITPRAAFGVAVNLCSHSIFIIGGVNSGGVLASTDDFTPETGNWHCTSNLNMARMGLAAGYFQLYENECEKSDTENT